MYFDDHEPPHFHATYGEHKARFLIEPVDLMDAEFPAKQGRLVRMWAHLHKDELLENWQLARVGVPLRMIDPLP